MSRSTATDEDPGARSISAGPLHVDLWQMEPAADHVTADAAHSVMSSAEIERERRFAFEKDRVLYRNARLLVRTVLAHELRVEAGDLQFDKNRHGRPRFAHAPASDAAISFNLAHTAGLIVFAVARVDGDAIGSRGLAVGIDAEAIRPSYPVLEVADSFFSCVEVQVLRSLAAPERARRFFEMWTVKEAFLKARGEGLSTSPDRLTVVPVSGRIDVEFDPSLEEDESHWTFRQYWPTRHHVAAVAVRDAGAELAQICRRTTDSAQLVTSTKSQGT